MASRLEKSTSGSRMLTFLIFVINLIFVKIFENSLQTLTGVLELANHGLVSLDLGLVLQHESF